MLMNNLVLNYFNSLMLFCIMLLNIDMSLRDRSNTNVSRQKIQMFQAKRQQG